MSATYYLLEFNGWEFRVMASRLNRATGATEHHQVGKTSGDLQLAMRSAAAELGGATISVPLEVAQK